MSGQLVYLDESGDAGFKLSKGSTPTLVIAAVVFDDASAAETTAKCLCGFRRDALGKGDGFQFHFTNLRHDWRCGLLEAVRDCPFTIRAIVVDKRRVRGEVHLERSGERFYRHAINTLLLHSSAQVENAKLFIDGEAGSKTLQKLVSYLRQQCREADLKVFREIKFVPKRQNNVLMQLADVVVGGIARSYRDEKRERNTYREIIARRIVDVREFVE